MTCKELATHIIGPPWNPSTYHLPNDLGAAKNVQIDWIRFDSN